MTLAAGDLLDRLRQRVAHRRLEPAPDLHDHVVRTLGNEPLLCLREAVLADDRDDVPGEDRPHPLRAAAYVLGEDLDGRSRDRRRLLAPRRAAPVRPRQAEPPLATRGSRTSAPPPGLPLRPTPGSASCGGLPLVGAAASWGALRTARPHVTPLARASAGAGSVARQALLPRRPLAHEGDAGRDRQRDRAPEGFEQAVERLSGREVLSYASQVLFDPDYVVEIAVLGEPFPPDAR